MTGNTSHAVRAQRAEPHDSLDFFPTPPWATRAVVEIVRAMSGPLDERTCWEPACGQGHMARPLAETFGDVFASDVHPYGYGAIVDFLLPFYGRRFDWIITNPPFRLGEEFILTGLDRAHDGVAVLVRTAFLESVGRYERLFKVRPPTAVAQFVERVPMVKGRVDEEASTATSYAWLIWSKGPAAPGTKFLWIPPCRSRLERPGDYAAVTP
jgi:hypothetical protein